MFRFVSQVGIKSIIHQLTETVAQATEYRDSVPQGEPCSIDASFDLVEASICRSQ